MTFWYFKIKGGKNKKLNHTKNGFIYHDNINYFSFMKKICVEYNKLDYINDHDFFGIGYKSNLDENLQVIIFDIYSKAILIKEDMNYQDLLTYNIDEIKISKIKNDNISEIISDILYLKTLDISNDLMIKSFFNHEFGGEYVEESYLEMKKLIESIDIDDEEELIYINLYETDNFKYIINSDFMNTATVAYINIFNMNNHDIFLNNLNLKLSFIELKKIFSNIVDNIENDEEISINLENIINLINHGLISLDCETINYESDLTYISNIFIENNINYFEYNNIKIPTSGNNIEFFDDDFLLELLPFINNLEKYKNIENKIIEYLAEKSLIDIFLY